METDSAIAAASGFTAAAVDPLSLLWRTLAAIAIGGLVLLVIFAIIEPGPLVRRRPFPRKRRSARPSVDLDLSDVPGSSGVDAAKQDGATEGDGVESRSESEKLSGR